MQITVRCPRCETEYHLSPELQGQRMRCPSAQCKAVFEVKPIEEDPPAGLPRPSEGSRAGPAAPVVEQTSGAVGDLVPILPAEAADGEGEGDSTPALLPDVPLAPAEAVDAPAEKTWQEPPPARRVPASTPPPPTRAAPAPMPAPARASAPPPTTPTVTPPRPRVKKEVVPVSAPKPAPPKSAPPSWQNAPPPVRRTADANETQKIAPIDTGTMKTPAPNGKVDEDAVLRELAGGDADTSSVHRNSADEPSAETETSGEAVPPRRSKLKWIMAGTVLATICVLGIVGFVVFWTDAHSEAERFRKGLDAYTHRQNEKATRIFSDLVADFPESENKDTYEFLRDWSHLRSQIFRPEAVPVKNIAMLAPWVKRESKNPIFVKYKDDVGETYLQVLDDRFELALRELKPEDPDAMEAELEEAAPYIPAERVIALRNKIGDLRLAIARKLLREEVIKELTKLRDNPTNDMLERAAEILNDARPLLPDIARDPEVRKLMAQLLDARRGLVVWHDEVVPFSPPVPDGEPALWVCTHLDGVENPAAPGRIVFALARGVLYALDQGSGQIRWATRVGVDTTTLPVRITPRAAAPELVLVLSSDTNTLTVRDVRTGKALGRHRLSAPCLGRPLVIGPKAYLPTYDGRVYEIDLDAATQVGWFDLGKPLSIGGSRQEGTNLLYFPADERYVFIIDVAERKCPAMLLSDHPAGSLRSEPVIISRADQRRDRHLEESAFPDYLVLSQAAGLDSMKLRVFPLPIEPGVGRPAVLGPEPEVPGWSWFPPFQNCERIVQVTDEGVVGLIGINQFRNQDKDLFLEMKYQIPAAKADDRKGRAQVVHASENDIWVLARGGLRLWHFDRFGPTLLPLWQQPLNLGSPLHAAQVDEGRALVLVTQSPAEPICKVTAVSPAADRDVAEIRWQKQLGLLCRGEPVLIGGQVLMLDQAGGLFQFDPKDHAAANGWEAAGKRVAPGLAAAARGPYLLPSEDGASLDILALSPLGRLVVRRYEPGKKIELRSYASFGLPSSSPARMGKGLVLPLENGMLVHLPSEGKGTGDTGPEWRARHADRDVPGFVASLGGDEFVSTDGSRGLTRWRWGGGRDFEKKTSSDDLPARIVAAPLVLPRAKDGGVLVCAADARGTLSLWTDTAAGGKEQTWKFERGWDLKGRITAGPVLRGNYMCCIVDRHRLVCINPTQAGFAWEYQDEGSHIVGMPQRVNGSLIVALQSGKFVALNPATGKPRDQGLRLNANVAPVAAPVPFGDGRVLAPLSDGTLMIVTLKQLGG